MKSILKLAVIASAVLVSSCGKSDENNNYQGGDDSSLILGNVYNANSSVGKHFPKKMIQNEDRRGNETIFEVSNGKVTKIGSFLCEYEGNLLKKIKHSDGSTTEREYFYSNGKISKAYFRNEGTWDYSYDSKKRLSKKIRTLPDGRQEITEYQYIDDNTVKTITNGQEYIYTFANGNLVREETPNNTITYQYDNKNNWRYANKFSLVIDGPLATFLGTDYSKNNLTKVVISGNYGSDQVTFEYEYNSEGYPTKVTDSRGTVIQYEY